MDKKDFDVQTKVEIIMKENYGVSLKKQNFQEDQNGTN